MSCAGRGICGCGRDQCAEAAWWFQWGGLWWLVAFEIAEQLRDAATDDDIDFGKEQTQGATP